MVERQKKVPSIDDKLRQYGAFLRRQIAAAPVPPSAPDHTRVKFPIIQDAPPAENVFQV